MTEAAKFEFQFSSAAHERAASLAGLWLFLASELLFFGPLFLAWIYSFLMKPAGFAHGARLTNLTIGSINTAILISGSFAFSLAVAFIRRDDRRKMKICLVAALTLGAAFMILKFGVEWPEDFRRGYFPGDHFAILGERRDGARLFFAFYFIGTAVHGAHLTVGLALISWLLWTSARFSAQNHSVLHLVGLYWSFVDLIWIALFPFIYLFGRL